VEDTEGEFFSNNYELRKSVCDLIPMGKQKVLPHWDDNRQAALVAPKGWGKDSIPLWFLGE